MWCSETKGLQTYAMLFPHMMLLRLQLNLCNSVDAAKPLSQVAWLRMVHAHPRHRFTPQ